MAYPQLTFSTLDQLRGYVNENIIPNNLREITGEKHNNAANGFIDFIKKAVINWDKVQIISEGGVLSITKPFVLIQEVVPDSLTWSTNMYNEFYITNTTDEPIPLVGVGYFDFNLDFVDYIPPNSNVHIAQATNNAWIQMGGAEAGFNPIEIQSPILYEDGILSLLSNEAGGVVILDENGKIPAGFLPSGLVDGSGTAGVHAKWSDANTLTDSLISESGTLITAAGRMFVDGGSTTNPFTVNGTLDPMFITFNNTATNGRVLIEMYAGVAPRGRLQFYVTPVTAGTSYAMMRSNGSLRFVLGDTEGDYQFGLTGTNNFSPTLMRMFRTGNLQLNSDIDQGYKLFVNGTAAIAGAVRLSAYAGVGDRNLGVNENGDLIIVSGGGGGGDVYTTAVNTFTTGSLILPNSPTGPNLRVGALNFQSIADTDGVVGHGLYYDTDHWERRTTYASSALYQSEGKFYFLNAPAGTAGDSVAPATRMFIDETGRVGIGTGSSALGARLTVATPLGESYLNISAGTNKQAAIIFSDIADGAGSQKFILGTDSGDIGYDDLFIYDATNSVIRLLINPIGNVGIGTVTPQVPLEVVGEIRTSPVPSTGNGAFLQISGYHAGFDASLLVGSYYGSGVYKDIAFLTSGVEAMRIDIDGRVGIGTNDPLGKLHIQGSAGVAANIWMICNPAVDNYAQMIFGEGVVEGEYAQFIRYSNASAAIPGDFLIYNGLQRTVFSQYYSGGYREDLVIDSTGNIGIGVSTPGVTLDVRRTGTANMNLLGTDGASNEAYIQIGVNGDTVLIEKLAPSSSSYGLSAGTAVIYTNNHDVLISNFYDSGTGFYRKDLVIQADGVVKALNDIEITTVGKSFIEKSPDGTRWRITVSNAGVVGAVTA